MAWYIPFDRLGPKQLEVLNGITGQLDRSHWVQGFAGTGKTLIITHLMEQVANRRPGATLCFVAYTHALKDLVESGLHGAVANRVTVKTHVQYLSEGVRFDYVFIDEVQDIPAHDLAKIKENAGQVYVAGDVDQRIYEHGAREEEISKSISPAIWKLFEIFRLTKLLQKVAQAILPKTRLIAGLHAGKIAEVSIRLVRHPDPQAEASWVWREASKRARAGEPSVILFPTHASIARFIKEVFVALGLGAPPEIVKKDYAPVNSRLRAANINLNYFGNNIGEISDGDNKPFVFLMTFHSSKGLDFRNVFIPGMTSKAVIVHSDVLKTDPEMDRRLLFVAVTRSRENLFISYTGDRPHALLSDLPNEVVANVSPVGNKEDEDEEFF